MEVFIDDFVSLSSELVSFSCSSEDNAFVQEKRQRIYLFTVFLPC